MRNKWNDDSQKPTKKWISTFNNPKGNYNNNEKEKEKERKQDSMITKKKTGHQDKRGKQIDSFSTEKKNFFGNLLTSSSKQSQKSATSSKNYNPQPKPQSLIIKTSNLTNSSAQNFTSQPDPTRSSMQSRWNRQSQIGTRSGIMRQYKRFFYDGKNVNYQQTALMKQAQLIKSCRNTVIFLFIVNFLFWFALWSITPYDKNCPRHATCGAYVHCHQGYLLNEQLDICQVDPKVTETAMAIMNSVVEDMKLQWGEKECTIPKNATQYQIDQHLSPPKKSLGQIFKNLGIQDNDFQLLRNILTKHFNDKNTQQIGKFKKDAFQRIYPQQKKYSITCKMDLLYKNNFQIFIFFLALALIVLVLSLVYLSHYLYRRKGRRIYNFMRGKTLEKKEIHYDHYRVEIQETFNKGRQIPEELWLLINEVRIKQRIIGSYEVNEGVHQGILWRSLTSL